MMVWWLASCTLDCVAGLLHSVLRQDTWLHVALIVTLSTICIMYTGPLIGLWRKSQFCWFFRVTFVETKMAFSWEIHRNFWDKFCWKTISKKWPISWQFFAHNYFAAKRSVLHWFDKHLRRSLLKNLPMAILSFFENDECWSVQ